MKPGPLHQAGAAHPLTPGARGLLLPPLLLLLVKHATGAQRWRSENFERPVDLEGSGDDDSFPDDELDDLYSGSGSGCKYPLPFSYISCQQCPIRGFDGKEEEPS